VLAGVGGCGLFGEHGGQKQASLTTIGYICEGQDPDLRAALTAHSNAILTAVFQGARKEETNDEARFAAITALGDSLEFVASNFKHEGERNYIVQVVCEATQADDSRTQQGAFGCLNRIMSLCRGHLEVHAFGSRPQAWMELSSPALVRPVPRCSMPMMAFLELTRDRSQLRGQWDDSMMAGG
jgi:hypothetical protein